MCQIIGFDPISVNGLGLIKLSSEILVPNPPASMTIFIDKLIRVLLLSSKRKLAMKLGLEEKNIGDIQVIKVGDSKEMYEKFVEDFKKVYNKWRDMIINKDYSVIPEEAQPKTVPPRLLDAKMIENNNKKLLDDNLKLDFDSDELKSFFGKQGYLSGKQYFIHILVAQLAMLGLIVDTVPIDIQ